MEDNIKKAHEIFDNDNGYIKEQGIVIDEIREGYTRLSMKLDDKKLNPYKIVHGGSLFGLADTAMGVCASSFGRNAVTLNANIDYLKPGTGKYIYCIAKAIKCGKTIVVIKCELYNDKDELISTSSSTYYFI